MSLQTILATLLCLTALCSYVNYRFLKLSPSIGVTFIALLFSTFVVILARMQWLHIPYIADISQSMDFNSTFMGGMISFLLFAGALQVNTLELAKEKTMIVILATVGVVISTLIVGLLLWWVTQLLGVHFALIDCLIFGALIAPTDPIAVIGILKKISAPKALEMKIAGESLFNDGTGIVLFVVLLSLAVGEQKPDSVNIALLFSKQLFGGLLYGALLGFGVSLLLKKVNDFHVSALLTLAMVSGGYLFGLKLEVSGPIAIVVAGLIVGTKLRSGIMAEGTIRQLSSFWTLLDESLNAILFVLIGLEFMKIPLSFDAAISALAAIPIVLFARLISVAAPVSLFRPFRQFPPYVVRIMTWGGLRGGISIALALSLQASPIRDEIITVTYAVVVFSLLVQGLTIGPYIQRKLRHHATSL